MSVTHFARQLEAILASFGQQTHLEETPVGFLDLCERARYTARTIPFLVFPLSSLLIHSRYTFLLFSYII